jgi:hypothetical protein
VSVHVFIRLIPPFTGGWQVVGGRSPRKETIGIPKQYILRHTHTRGNSHLKPPTFLSEEKR